MTVQVYDYNGVKRVREFLAEPVCAQDFCDSCGDCLACYSEDDCVPGNFGHVWVAYGGDEARAIETRGET